MENDENFNQRATDEENPFQASKADEIVKMFREQVFVGASSEDRAHRATKVICTLGE